MNPRMSFEELKELGRRPEQYSEVVRSGGRQTMLDVKLFHLNAEFLGKRKKSILRALAIVGLINILTITFFAESLPWAVLHIPFLSNTIALVSFAGVFLYFARLLRDIEKRKDNYHFRVAFSNSFVVIAWFLIAFPVLNHLANLLTPEYWILSQLRIPWIGIYVLTLLGYLGTFGSIRNNVDLAGQYWKKMEDSSKSYLRYLENGSDRSDLEDALDNIEQARGLLIQLRYRMSSFSRTHYMLALIRKKAWQEGIDPGKYVRKGLIHVYNPIERIRRLANLPRNMVLMTKIALGRD